MGEKDSSENSIQECLVSRIREGKVFHKSSNPQWPQVVNWYDEIKQFRNETDRQAFERMHGLENIRKGLVNNEQTANIKDFVLQSIQHLQGVLKMEESKKKTYVGRNLIDYWHSLKMSGPVKNGVLICIGTVFAALIGGAFLIVSTLIQNHSKDSLVDKSRDNSVQNSGVIQQLQQQNGKYIINNYPPNNTPGSLGREEQGKPILSMVGLGFINDSQMIVRLENSGGSDLPAQAILRFGLVPFNGNTPMKGDISWLAPRNKSAALAGKSQSYVFDIPENQKKLMKVHAVFVVIFVQNDLLIDGVMSDIGYTWNAGQSWAKYWENVGNVDAEQGKQIESFVDSVKFCIAGHLKDKEYDHCFS